jgi:hypothetical protein
LTRTALAPEQARKKLETAVEELRKSVIVFLEGQGGHATLVELVGHLLLTNPSEELVSRAVAGLLTKGTLVLTDDREVLLKP